MINFFKRIAKAMPESKYPDPRHRFKALPPTTLLEQQLQVLEHHLHSTKEDLQHAVEMREEWDKAVNERLEIVDELEKQIQYIKDFIK